MNYSSIAEEINKMSEEDQKARKLGSKNIGSIDKKNDKRMKEIVTNIGYPTISKVGKQASFNSWLIIQHSPDLEFQVMCLDLMKKQFADVNPQNIAYLEDRILMYKGEPQIYGTQLKKNTDRNKFELYIVKDPNNVDKLRKSIGLEPVEDYLKKFE
jgi:hypothetical protein